jgi:hypothetical protein
LGSSSPHSPFTLTSCSRRDGNVEFDGTAIRGILNDPEVVAYIESLRLYALLPEKRNG